jgi:hypothetical protein
MSHNHIWTPAGTDITIRWRMLGWVPPSEQAEYQMKWKYFQELPMRRLDDLGKQKYEDALRRANVARIK